ncbi:hypothetical protein ACP70R_042471 [Stipagrostis hirtigluma subsp. patula]
MASLPDPSSFAVAVAVGYAHILNSVLAPVERARMRTPLFVGEVLAVLLAFPVLMTYLVVVTVAFAFRVAAGVYAPVVADGAGDATLAQALSPPAILDWFANTVIKLAVAFFVFSIGSSAMNLLRYIPKLTGQNYGTWREELETGLALAELDLALQEPSPTEPVAPVRGQYETGVAWATRKRDFARERTKYNLDKAKWDKSNRECLMVIKMSIIEDIRDLIPECATASEYLERVKP